MLLSTCKFHVHRCTPCGVHMFHWTSAAAQDGMWLDFDVRSEKNIIGSLFAGIFHIWHTYIWLKWNSSYLAMSWEWKSQVDMKGKWLDFGFQKDLRWTSGHRTRNHLLELIFQHACLVFNICESLDQQYFKRKFGRTFTGQLLLQWSLCAVHISALPWIRWPFVEQAVRHNEKPGESQSIATGGLVTKMVLLLWFLKVSKFGLH